MKATLLTLTLGISFVLSSCQFNINLSLVRSKTPKKPTHYATNYAEYFKNLRDFHKKLRTSYKYEAQLTQLPTLPVQKIITRTDNFLFVRDSMITYAKQHLGIRYRSGGMSTKGFDCSGFTSYVMSYFGYKIPHASSAQALVGDAVAMEDLQKGDLIFFGYKGKNGHYRVSHAAMVCSEKGETLAFIHAARSGIKIDDVKNSSWRCYYKKRFLFGKRVIDYHNTTEFVDNIIAFQNK